jgi:O-antigen/teichoic acid export membrane protein
MAFLDRMQERVVRLLRWSERYTKTDMVYLAYGGFWSGVGQFSASLSSLVLAIVVSRYLPKEIYGEYKYILSAVALLSVFTLNGLGGAVLQSVAHGFDAVLEEGFWINIRWSVLMFAGAFFVSAYYFVLHNYELAFGILLGGCLSPFLTSANLSNSFLSGKKDFARSALYFDILANFIPVGALIATVLLTKNALALAFIYFASNTLIALYLYRRVLRTYKPQLHKTDSGALTYSKHLSLMGILGGIADNIDQILLFHYVGAAQLAVYNFATAIPDQAKGPLKRFDSMVQARFAARTNADIRSGMRHKILLLVVFYAVITAAYILVAPFIYKIFFPNYMDSIFYTQVYACSMLVFPLGIANSYLSVRKKVREQYLVTVASGIFQIVAMAFGVITWGLIGLVIARVVSRFFTSGTSYLLYLFSTD